VSENSIIHDSVDKKKFFHLGPFSLINENVVIGDNVFIGSGVKIGAGSIIGDNCILYDNVVLYDNTSIGGNSIIHSGTVIGSDGFGYHTNDNFHHKIPHIKNVLIGKNVELGASCTIDRGSVQDTIIGDYCKLDNQVHLAHTVEMGNGCLIAGGVFIGGSTIIEDCVTIGGKSDVGPHITIGSKAVLAARSCVLKSLPGSEMYGGNPARPIKEKQKRDALYTRFKILEKKLKNNAI
jgi:UDP-3-O-[3-hydroxymyristoyl] glucosamine N-acyltransferase